MILFILITLIPSLFAVQYNFTQYTHRSTQFGAGEPCLTGCDSNNECVINWKWAKKDCKKFEVAPIYRTSQKNDPLSKYCLSNCGYFGEAYQWCITTTDLKWDFCSSYEGTAPFKHPEAQTRHGKHCTDECREFHGEKEHYYWCNTLKADGQKTWEYCAPPPSPRVPVLPNDFHIGAKLKSKCDDFFQYVSPSINCLSATDVADNYVTKVADAIDGSVTDNLLMQVFKVTDTSIPIDNYTMVKIKDVLVPAVIRAHVTNQTIGDYNQTDTPPPEFERKLREQMSGSSDSYVVGQLIGSQLGGPNKDYNIVPRSVDWKYEEWWDMEQTVKQWCKKTGGSVDMVVVVFYKDWNTPIPRAFGVSLAFRNADNSLFVDCTEKVHWNYF